MEARMRPSAVMGPFDLRPFFLHASILAWDVMVVVTSFGKDGPEAAGTVKRTDTLLGMVYASGNSFA
jgi:hypothetical protein